MNARSLYNLYNPLLGFQIITSEYMTETKTPTLYKTVRKHSGEVVKKRYQLKPVTVPMSDVLFDKERNVIYCHPTIANALKDKLAEVTS